MSYRPIRFNPNRNADLDRLAEDFGIVMDGAIDFLRPEWRGDVRVAMDAASRDFGRDPRADYSFDAAQVLSITASNAGIPAFLTNFVDPKFIEVFTAPLNATEIAGEVKKGDWTTLSSQFPLIESMGTVATYDDYSNNG